jgi:hypothetical protein
MKRITVLILISLSILILLSLSCKNTGVQPPDKTFALTVDDASCTEVYLNLKIGTGITSRTVTLKRDTITLFSKTIDAAETVFVDSNLVPNHTYNYTGTIGSLVSNSTAQTMDTTNHSFSWQTFTLGDGSGSSTLYDVAIINDTLAYAVGAVYQGGSVYNLAMWNGQTWTLQQLLFQGFPPVIHSIFATNDHDMWLDPWFHWNGQSFQELSIDPIFIGVGINKMWGNSNDMYVVGNNGFIAHYNGSSWTKIESSTILPFQDIYGSGNEVLAIASDKFGLGGKYLVHLSGNNATQVPTDIPTAVSFSSIWFESGRRYYLAGNGIYTKHSLSGSSWQMDPFTNELQTYEYAIRGTGPNDVVVVGEGGAIGHFNGKSWRSYSYAGQTAGDRLSSVCIKNNQIVAVGTRYIDGTHDRALICIGRR